MLQERNCLQQIFAVTLVSMTAIGHSEERAVSMYSIWHAFEQLRYTIWELIVYCILCAVKVLSVFGYRHSKGSSHFLADYAYLFLVGSQYRHLLSVYCLLLKILRDEDCPRKERGNAAKPWPLKRKMWIAEHYLIKGCTFITYYW